MDTTGMLSALARGLRAGAGVLSPEVFAQNEQERQRKMLQSEEGKQMMAKLIAEGMRDGSIQPDQGMQALERINPQFAEQLKAIGGMGPSLEAQQAAQERAAYAELSQKYGLPAGTPKELILAEHKARNPAPTKADNALMNLVGPDGRKVTLRRSDPRGDVLLGQGWTEYEKPSRPPAEQGDASFGKSMVGLAYQTVLDIEARTRAGQPIPPELAAQGQVAKQILTQERIVVGPDGERMAYTPGLPQFGAQAEPASGGIATPGGGRMVTLATKAGDSKPEDALSAIGTVTEILNEAAEAGETVTGVVGTLKRHGGGLARQAGIPVSPRTERLSRSLERLQAMVGPSILSDSRLSNEERARVEEIVGTVNPKMDDIALRESLADLAAILGKVSAPSQKKTPNKRVVVDW